MKVIAPVAITDVILTASNVAEADHPEWSAATTYAKGDRVIVLATHRIYESAIASNTGNDPVTDSGANWIEISATNRWKAFDQKIADQVSNAGTISYSIIPDRQVTGLAFFRLDAAQVRVQIFDNGSPAAQVYDQTVQLVDTTAIVDWFTFFTWQAEYDEEALFVGVPGYAGYRIDITIGDGTGTARVGQVVVGAAYRLGDTIDGTSIGIEDFSTKERDDFGNAVIVQRAFADTVDFDFAMNTADARRVKRILSSLRATPAVYFADEAATEFGTTVYGFFQDFAIPLSAGGKSFATLEIEGLT